MNAHSPLGASGAERWMKCPGSVRLLQHLDLGHSDEEDWTREGTAMHAAAAHCLTTGADAWETVGQEHGGQGIVMTPALADPIQTYLGHVRYLLKRGGPSAKHYIEYRIASPVHPLYFGTLDDGIISLESSGLAMDITDLKGGEGQLVDVEDNPQLKYYAFGLIDGIERQEGRAFPDTMQIRLHICQPRITWADPIRSWTTTAYTLKAWVHGILVPSMKATEMDDGLDAGPWCRFCPAKLVCPLLTAMARAAVTANPKHVEGMTMDRLAMEYQAAKAVEFYLTAVKRETFKQLMKGETDDRLKLVKKKANRAWRPGAEALTKAKFGAEAMTEPKLKSPAQISELPGGPAWVSGNAFTPDTGLTVALATDPGTAQKVPKLAERFAAALDAVTAETVASEG